VSLVKSIRRFPYAVPLLVTLAATAAAAGPAARAPGRSAPGDAPALEQGEFNPALWDSLLGLYVKPDGVDYAAWKADGTGALDRFLDAAAGYDLGSTMAKEPRAAFLVNAYNAWAVRQILEHYPVKSVKDIGGFFDKNTHRIAGKDRTLDDIESELAAIVPHRPLFAFALAPGARGMPALAATAYRSRNFNSRIQAAALTYLTPERLHYDQEDSTLYIPPQFRKHLDLFQALPNGLKGVLGAYMRLSSLSALLATTEPRYADEEVDWSLDQASSGAPASGKAK